MTIQYSPEETKKMTKKSGAMEALEVIPEVGPLLPVAKGQGHNLQHRRLNRGRRYVISISVWKPSSTIYKLESEKIRETKVFHYFTKFLWNTRIVYQFDELPFPFVYQKNNNR